MFQLSFALPVLWGVVLVFTLLKKNTIQQPYFSMMVALLCGFGAVLRISGYAEIGTLIEVLGLLLIAYRVHVYQKWKGRRA
ncbi:MAG: hypothetical protein OEY67_07120 [Gammaproteobacteria bacterium]|nr:hypothetical protein [Gammaproteobacteria bacterium]